MPRALLRPLSVDGPLPPATIGLLKPSDAARRRARYAVRLAFVLGIAVALLLASGSGLGERTETVDAVAKEDSLTGSSGRTTTAERSLPNGVVRVGSEASPCKR